MAKTPFFSEEIREKGVKSLRVPVELLVTISKTLERAIIQIENEDISNSSAIDVMLQENLLDGEDGLCAMHRLLNLQIDIGVKYAKC